MELDYVQEPAMAHIREVATITSKGQITLPKPIRQALGVDSGGQVALRTLIRKLAGKARQYCFSPLLRRFNPSKQAARRRQGRAPRLST